MADGGNEDRGTMLVVFREVAEGLKRLDADDRHRIVDAVLDWYTGGTGEVEGLSPTAAHGDNYIGATEEQRKEFSDGFGE